ncbi:MAG: hypothetical protein E5V49_14150 [Mesorhizobium sp.]|nr:hypothetical protein EN848_09915 [bacterium M00.F.Ca.ET.205.01.1.1]TGU55728.1 hypothetical protein EN795_03110 [bacterium M00.F.Ca.ET.152.01.1.1]TGV39997.1 hypothetical protein EN829_001315 [Mesorhizobium sp. M00.F.Ca.ET.186.01.1.1]TGZ44980.1 hypothetical protein EN805_01310 [bacterium M00.F.Ca.ET.162.01.1.1]TJW31973.1 MAG: hypothetical protein E5V49_14150 [Mesorhizobium sp.]
MRKVFWAPQVLISALAAAWAGVIPVMAEDVYNLNQNESGFNLPGVTLPQGQDEVHAADGTTCRSAVSGSGAYVDLGVIRGNNQSNNDVATYGRVVIPIGRTPKRVDCSRLYELEVERLQLELKLLKMGLGADGQTASVATSAPAPTVASPGWANEGWSIRTGNGDGKKKKRK